MKQLVLAAFTVLGIGVNAQMTTPGTGVHWTLDSLVAHFPSGISQSTTIYQMTDSLEISKNDTLSIVGSYAWMLGAAVEVKVFGTLIMNSAGGGAPFITAIDTMNHYEGFRFEDSSFVNLQHAVFFYGGGLRVLTPNFYMNTCMFTEQISGASSSSVINFSRGTPVVLNSIFIENEYPAFGSGANQEVAPVIKYNLLVGNNQSNTNRPQINLGPSGASDTTIIIGNTLIGDSALDNAGGISVSSLLSVPLNAIIDSNEIRNHRYGITMAGANITGYIRHNIIEDNNTQNLPMLGGSGISLNAATPTLNVIATGNEIRRNLWGITVIGKASINLGDTLAASYNEGKNIFSDNGNGGVTYAIYNNTDLPVSALYNCWEEDTSAGLTAEDVIFHMADDVTLGEVFYNPVWNCMEDSSGVGLVENVMTNIEIYPNPGNGDLTIDLERPSTIEVYDISGRLQYSTKLFAGAQTIQLDVAPGIYVINISDDSSFFSEKIIVR